MTEDMTEEKSEEVVEKKVKKVVRRRKTKKERENPLTTAVRLVVESGKVDFGTNQGINASLTGKAKLFVIADNVLAGTKEKIESFAKKSNIPVIVYSGSSMELGSVCGRPFPVSVISVFNVGSSNILELAK